MGTERFNARVWIKSGKHEIPKRMPSLPDIDSMYDAGAERVDVEYDPESESEHMKLIVTFPKTLTGVDDLCAFMKKCFDDGVSHTGAHQSSHKTRWEVHITILGEEENK